MPSNDLATNALAFITLALALALCFQISNDLVRRSLTFATVLASLHAPHWEGLFGLTTIAFFIPFALLREFRLINARK